MQILLMPIVLICSEPKPPLGAVRGPDFSSLSCFISASESERLRGEIEAVTDMDSRATRNGIRWTKTRFDALIAAE